MDGLNMSKRVRTEEELGEALKSGADTIEIEGNLASTTLKIRATGNVAWGVCVGAIGIAVVGLILTAGTGGASAPVTATTAGLTAVTASTVLGTTVTYSAIAIAVTAGGVGALNKLRAYEQVSFEDNLLILKRKK